MIIQELLFSGKFLLDAADVSAAVNLQGVGIATVVVASVGLFIGLFLGFAAKTFAVKTDEREIQIRELLPGANCGGCGYPGCDGMASAIAKGQAPANGCPVANSEAHKKIAEVMGTSVVETEKKVAFIKCSGTCDKTEIKYEYY